MHLKYWPLFGLACLGAALPNGAKDKRYTLVSDNTTYTVFEHAATAAKISYVTNSGICETTPGVNQYSGYLTVGEWTCHGWDIRSESYSDVDRHRQQHEHVVLVLRVEEQPCHSTSRHVAQRRPGMF
jgi:hypothetical protein